MTGLSPSQRRDDFRQKRQEQKDRVENDLRKAPRLKIVSDQDVVTDARVFMGDVDITKELMVTKIAIDLTIGEVAKAKLECLCVRGEVSAILDAIVVQNIGSSPLGRVWWRLKKWWWSR